MTLGGCRNAADRFRLLVPVALVFVLLGDFGICPCLDPAATVADEHGCCAPETALRDGANDCCASALSATNAVGVNVPAPFAEPPVLAGALPALARAAVGHGVMRAVPPTSSPHPALRI